MGAASGCTQRETEKPVPGIGFLSSVPSTISTGLQQHLRELGYVEGRSIVVEWRWTEGKAERVPQLAAELVGLKPDLIVTTPVDPAVAVMSATATIPIVAVAVGDPVRLGLVPNLARPGGNLAGPSNLPSSQFSGKMLGLLHRAVPAASRVGVLINPSNADYRSVVSSDLPPIAGRLGLTLGPIEVSAASELDAAFGQAARVRADAILVLGDPVIYVHRARIPEVAARQRMPALYFFRENVEAGGLMSYGPSLFPKCVAGVRSG